MSTATATRVSVAAVARECLDECHGNVKAACQAFDRRMDADRELMAELFRPLRANAVKQAIEHSMRQERRSMHAAPAPRSDDVRGIELVAERSWYDYPLTGGKKLGDATRADLAAMVKIHRENQASNARRANWLEAIQKRLPTDGRTVRECVADADIAKLAKEHGP